MKKFFKLLCVVLILICLISMVFKPEIYVTVAFDGIKLWALTVLPSLLPFFFFTTLLSKLGVTGVIARIFAKPSAKLFRSGGVCAYAFLMSILSGYPVGAKIIADLYANGYINKDESTRLSCLCSTSGPLFIVGSVGIGMFNSKNVGYVILITHLLSAFICGIIFRFYGKQGNGTARILSLDSSENLLYESVYSSVISVLCVGGFICVFNVILNVAKNVNAFAFVNVLFGSSEFKDLIEPFLYGLIECTNGCKMLANCNLSTYSLAFTSALISFGGASVWVQSITFLSSAKADLKIFCISKTVQAIISFLLTLLTVNLLHLF